MNAYYYYLSLSRLLIQLLYEKPGSLICRRATCDIAADTACDTVPI